MLQTIRRCLGLLTICFALTAQAQDFEGTKRAAERGDAKAQHNLGFMYAEGQGVARNDAEAVKWFRKAAKQGYAYAQYNLAVMYQEGRGVPKNHAKAKELYGKAAKHKLSIPEETKTKYPELIELVLGCESMHNNVEKQQWIDLLPSMTDEQRDRLRDIMLTERKQLLEGRAIKNPEEIRMMNERHLDEWRRISDRNAKDETGAGTMKGEQ